MVRAPDQVSMHASIMQLIVRDVKPESTKVIPRRRKTFNRLRCLPGWGKTTSAKITSVKITSAKIAKRCGIEFARTGGAFRISIKALGELAALWRCTCK
jgi:hypothetical protein